MKLPSGEGITARILCENTARTTPSHVRDARKQRAPKPMPRSCSLAQHCAKTNFFFLLAHLQTALAELHLHRAPSLVPQEPHPGLAALPHLLNPLSHPNHVPSSSQQPCHTPASSRDDDLGVTDGMTKRHQIHFPEPPDLPHRIPAHDPGAASTFGAVRADHSSHSAPPRLCSPTESRDLAQDETGRKAARCWEPQ